MKIVWLCNIALPEARLLMGMKEIPYGGWLIDMAERLSSEPGHQLSIVFQETKKRKSFEIQGRCINYYGISFNKNSLNDNIGILKTMLMKTQPDIVHIFGTEYLHTYLMSIACSELNIRYVISIQGLVSYYTIHYMAYLPIRIQLLFTLRDMLKMDNLYFQQKKIKERGTFEIKSIKMATNIIGRTTWDKACVNQINDKAKYFHCNESIREAFYLHEWNINDCEKYSIVLSQGTYPIKGLHLMLLALPMILKKYPNTRVYVCGDNIVRSDRLKDLLRLSGYAYYIKKIIKKFNLHNHVVFLGPQSEKEMCERLKKSHVFVCPSSIENSPNSLGEAMLLGMPCVASDVGGVSDMMIHKLEGFVYPADEYYMLAYYISEIFSNDELATVLGKKARQHALVTHDRENNFSQLLEIYKEICGN